MTIPYTQSIPSASQPDPYLQLIKQVFRIDDVTWGTEDQNFFVRYRGNLLIDSQEAYEKLSTGLIPHEVTPMFRL
jgi:hypothetical protein